MIVSVNKNNRISVTFRGTRSKKFFHWLTSHKRNAVETFGRIVRCFSLISINVVVYAAHAVETFGRIMRGCFFVFP